MADALSGRPDPCYGYGDMRLLMIEDEEKIAAFMRKGLKEAGYAVDLARDGDEGLEMALSGDYDLMIVDIMLPGIEGISLIQRIRKRKPQIPALIVSARGDPVDKVKGLDAGADDYLAKPFDFDELLARIRVLLRKRSQVPQELSCADLSLDPRRHCANRGGSVIELSNKEYALLEYLLHNQGQVLSRTQILNHVWQMDFDPGTNVVEVYIRYLRDKLDRDFEPVLIHTVRGTGYLLSDERKQS